MTAVVSWLLNQPIRGPCFSHYIMSVAVAHSVHFPGNEMPKSHRLLHTGGCSTSSHLGLCASLARAQFYTQAAISQPTPDDQLFSCFWPASLWFRDHNTTSRHQHDSEPSHASVHTDGTASVRVRAHSYTLALDKGKSEDKSARLRLKSFPALSSPLFNDLFFV